MRYIVSGYRRSGTGMMMRVLSIALPGRTVLYQPSQEKALNQKVGNYRPSPSGLLETAQLYYLDPRAMRERFKDEHVLKIFFDGLPTLPVFRDHHAYTIIFMLRAEAEINKSLEKVANYHYLINKEEQPPSDLVLNVYAPYDQLHIDHVLDIVRVRSDMQCFGVQYEDFVEDPLAGLQSLARSGVPLSNLEEAAAIVNPKLRRARVCE
jgi:hypothetical protein